MWRHAVAAAIAIAITLVMLEFWGDFGGAMSGFVKLKAASDSAKTPMPVSVMSTGPETCGKDAPCPQLPDSSPEGGPKSKP